MITRSRMKFMAAEDAGGGGAAVADAPPALAPLTPVGDVYNEALAKARGEEAKVSPEVPEVKPAKSGKAEEAVPEKPASALDAALSEAPAGETKKEEPFADALKEFPETLPRDGRGEHWARARAAIERGEQTVSQQAKTIADLTKQIDLAKAAPPETAQELAEVKAELDKYKDSLVGLNVRLDPKHQEKFVQGREKLVTKAASKLDAFGGKGELLREAFDMKEGRARTQAIKEALGELEDVEKARVLGFVADIEKLDDEETEIVNNSQVEWAKMKASRAENAAKEAEKVETYKKSVFEAVSKKLSQTLLPLRIVGAEAPGATEWNADAEAMKNAAWKLLGPDATAEETAEAALKAQVSDKLDALLRETRAELKKSQAALKEYEQSEPGFRGERPPKKSGKEAQLEKTPAQIYNETLANIQDGEG